MIVATRKNSTRDGELLIVSKDRTRAVSAKDIAPHFQYALDNWKSLETPLQELSKKLNSNACKEAFNIQLDQLTSPLPRAYTWVDGSSYLNHVILVRKARGAEPPATMKTDPLMYQGGSDSFLSPTEPILMASEDYGIDFESEVAVITDDVPMGVTVQNAVSHIRFIMICNDVSLRNLIPEELAKGFGFLQSKPSSAFAPFALTPDELGESWKGSRVHLPLCTYLNDNLFGDPDAGPEMHFSFSELIAHAAKTRPLCAGSIVGSGTVSNEDEKRGSSCLAEKRMIEKIKTGQIQTPFLKFGDRVKIEMKKDGLNLFGSIDQTVKPYVLK